MSVNTDERSAILRNAVSIRTAEIFGGGNDFTWLGRSLAMRQPNSDLTSELRQLVWNAIWAARFNDMNETGFREVQQLSARYLAENRFQSTQVRNFLVLLLMDHLMKLYTPPKVGWMYYALGVFGVIALLVPRSAIFALLFPVISVLSLFLRAYMTAVKHVELGKIHLEISAGAFDEATTMKRLQRIEKRGVQIPSILYGLLRQPKINAQSEMQAEWLNLPQARRDEIFNEERIWAKTMREGA